MEALHKTVNFAINGERVEITAAVDTEMNIPKNVYFGMTGTFEGGGGQCQKRIRAAAEGFAPVITVLDYWNQYHMKRPSKTIIAKIIAALDAIDGERFGDTPDISDAPDINECADILDSRDVIKALDIYRAAVEAAGLDPEGDGPDAKAAAEILGLWDDYSALKELDSQGEDYAPDWKYGETLINADYFTEYARELVSDIGDVPREIPHYIEIDWDKTANNLKVDYTAIEFKGETFYVR